MNKLCIFEWKLKKTRIRKSFEIILIDMNQQIRV